MLTCPCAFTKQATPLIGFGYGPDGGLVARKQAAYKLLKLVVGEAALLVSPMGTGAPPSGINAATGEARSEASEAASTLRQSFVAAKRKLPAK